MTRTTKGKRATAAATRSPANPKAAAGTSSAARTAMTTGVTFDMRTILSGQYNASASASCRCDAGAPSNRKRQLAPSYHEGIDLYLLCVLFEVRTNAWGLSDSGSQQRKIF